MSEGGERQARADDAEPRCTTIEGTGISLVGLARPVIESVLTKALGDLGPKTLFVSCLDDDDGVHGGRTYARIAEGVSGGPGHQVIAFPIRDGGVPRSLVATLALVREVRRVLDGKGSVLFGCAAGCGRSGMLAACALVTRGLPVGEALARVDRERRLGLRGVLATDDPIVEWPWQRQFVDKFARLWAAAQGPADGGGFTEPASGFVGAPGEEDVESALDRLRLHGNLEAYADAAATLAAFDLRGSRAGRLVEVAQEVGRLLDSNKIVSQQNGFSEAARKPVSDESIGGLVTLGRELLAAQFLDDNPENVPTMVAEAFSGSVPARVGGQPEQVPVPPGTDPGRSGVLPDAPSSAPPGPSLGAQGADMPYDEYATLPDTDLAFEKAIAEENYAVKYLARRRYYEDFDRIFPTGYRHPEEIAPAQPSSEGRFLRLRVLLEDYNRARQVEEAFLALHPRPEVFER